MRMMLVLSLFLLLFTCSVAVGGKFPVSQVGERELMAFREQERREMLRVLDDYLQICAQFGV